MKERSIIEISKGLDQRTRELKNVCKENGLNYKEMVKKAQETPHSLESVINTHLICVKLGVPFDLIRDMPNEAVAEFYKLWIEGGNKA